MKKDKMLEELSIKFEQIDYENLRKMKELLLIINAHYFVDEEDPFNYISYINHLKGDQIFYNWDAIIKKCQDYIKENPYEVIYDDVDYNPYDYTTKMIQILGLDMIKLEFSTKRIISFSKQKFDVSLLYTFLSYSLFFNYNLMYLRSEYLIRKILYKLLIEDKTLPYYYPLYEMTEIPYNHSQLKELENNMLPFYGTPQKFIAAYEEMNGIKYGEWLNKENKNFDE